MPIDYSQLNKLMTGVLTSRAQQRQDILEKYKIIGEMRKSGYEPEDMKDMMTLDPRDFTWKRVDDMNKEFKKEYMKHAAKAMFEPTEEEEKKKMEHEATFKSGLIGGRQEELAEKTHGYKKKEIELSGGIEFERQLGVTRHKRLQKVVDRIRLSKRELIKDIAKITYQMTMAGSKDRVELEKLKKSRKADRIDTIQSDVTEAVELSLRLEDNIDPEVMAYVMAFDQTNMGKWGFISEKYSPDEVSYIRDKSWKISVELGLLHSPVDTSGLPKR